MTRAEFRKMVIGCTMCKGQKVFNDPRFGTGQEDAEVMIIGGKPPKDPSRRLHGTHGIHYKHEDAAFLIELLAYLKVDSFYATWAHKCATHYDRRPDRVRSWACKTWLQNEIEMVKPEAFIIEGETARDIMGHCILGYSFPRTGFPVLRNNGKGYALGTVLAVDNYLLVPTLTEQGIKEMDIDRTNYMRQIASAFWSLK